MHNVRFVEGRGEALSFATGSFDVVMCLMSGLYPDEIHRVLKPGGVAVLEKLGTRDKENIKIAFGKDTRGLRGQYLEMDEMTMRADLRRDFDRLFSHVTIEERSWKTYYSYQGLLEHLSTPDEFTEEMEHHRGQNVLCLMDYELLGFTVTGFDLIEKFNLQDVAYLVTSRFEERDVIERCTASGVRMLPKPAAAYIPIKIKGDDPADNGGGQEPDAVLIDDDDLVHLMWLQAAQTAGKVLHVYFDPRAFFNALAKYRLSVPIYIDSELAQSEHAWRLVSPHGRVLRAALQTIARGDCAEWARQRR